MVRTIMTTTRAVLRHKAHVVTTFDQQLAKLLDDLAETMYAHCGIGLAATQIGIKRRVFVYDVGHGLCEMVNPILLAGEGQMKSVERCLSVPGLKRTIRRYARVRVYALNRFGAPLWVEAKGNLACCLQHEIDHMDGILLMDHEAWRTPRDTHLNWGDLFGRTAHCLYGHDEFFGHHSSCSD